LLAELQLLDPHENWAFLSWLLDERRLQFVEKVRPHTAPDIRAMFCFLHVCLVDMLHDRLKVRPPQLHDRNLLKNCKNNSL
jgi:hypothetical protein